MITAQELAAIIEMAATAPVRSYAHAKQHDALFAKMINFHKALASGRAAIGTVDPVEPVTDGCADLRGGIVVPAGGEVPAGVKVQE
jgi:hypothetical protein